MLPVAFRTSRGGRRVQYTRRLSAVTWPPAERNPSELLSASRLPLSTDGQTENRLAARCLSSSSILPVSPFVVEQCARHHPLARQRSSYCLATASPSFRSLLLRPHSPTTAFGTPC